MWVNERRRTIIRNVLIGLLLIAAAIGLRRIMTSVNQQIAQEDALLRAEHSSQRQELNEARQENLALIEQTYEQHLEVLNQYLPGIVCWGDSLTAGTSGNVSYPMTLQEYVNTNLCDAYDLRYAFDNAEIISRINPRDYKISIPVVNMGSGQENSATILGRAGVVPFVVQRNFVIPAEVESVTIYLASQNGSTVQPLMAGNAGMNPVTIAGVEGTIARIYKNGQYIYQFTRLEAGEEVAVPKNTEILTAAATEYQNYLHIIWMGAYDQTMSADKMVENVKKLLARQTQNSDRFLIIAPCALGGSWSAQMVCTLDSIDSAMSQTFGNHYISLRKYLISDGMRDAGLSESKNDATAIKAGCVPESFRSSASGVDMNAVAYELIAKLVYDRMDQLGYFDEVRTALNLG